MGLTTEQQKVINTVLSQTDNRIVAVNSVAGSGKSSTAKALVEAYRPKNGFLFAFNKAIIEDTKKRMNGMINCSTIHSLAYRHVNPSRRPEELNYNTITENIPYDEKATVISILDDFYRSSSTDIEEYANSRCNEPELCDLIVSYANRMLEGKIPPSFNYLLKVLQFLLLEGKVQIDFDLLILDECQDTTEVALEIFKLVNAKNKIMFGDKYQNIYSFMNTVNAFEELSDVETLYLTKSFRCNPRIAEIVEYYGIDYLDNSFLFKGNEDMVKSEHTEFAYITRTNSALIERMNYLMDRGQSFSLTRDVNEIFAFPIAMLNASQGRQVYDKRYKYLEKEYVNYNANRSYYSNYFDYIVTTTEDPMVEATCKILMNFANKRINLYKLKEDVTNMKPNKNVVLTTAHAFKGLEMDTVYIEEDLNNCINRVIARIKAIKANPDEFSLIPNVKLATSSFNDCIEGISLSDDTFDGFKDARVYLTKGQKEDLNTYYVALSRAKNVLLNAKHGEI